MLNESRVSAPRRLPWPMVSFTVLIILLIMLPAGLASAPIQAAEPDPTDPEGATATLSDGASSDREDVAGATEEGRSNTVPADRALPAEEEAASGEAAGDSLADPMDPSLKKHERLEALIEHIKREQNAMATLEAHFLQHRESELLTEAEESRGVFYYSAPDSVRWEYETPNPISVVIDGREMLTWYRDLKRADRYKISRYSSQVFKYMGASGSMETLTDYFVVSVRFPETGENGTVGGEYRLRLLPKYERISQKIKSMTLWIDAVRYLPTRLRYESADGDVTEYRFHDFKINDPIPTERFSLDLPSDVKIREVDLQQDAG